MVTIETKENNLIKTEQLDFLEEQSKIKTRLKVNDLIPTNNLKSIFENIRNYLAGNAKGITRDETLTQELMNLLFCKIHDEKNKKSNDLLDFYALYKENPIAVKNRIVNYFENKVKKEYGDVLRNTQIALDPNSIYYLVYELQRFNISDAERDVIGDAFESFFGPTLRGSEGQFFTPKNVVQMIIDILDPKTNEVIIDPACGSGGFLIMSLYHIYRKLVYDKKLNKPVVAEFKKIASNNVVGIDKDSFLTQITKAYMAIIGDGRGGIFCEDSLDLPEKWHEVTKNKVKTAHFDVLLTNPPFGAKIPIKDKEKLQQYKLGHIWLKDKKEEKWAMQNRLFSYQPPQILFIERCLQLLKDGGRMGIVLPEGLFGNPSDRYIWEFVFSNAKILAVISVPQETFQPSTHTKTSILFLEKSKPTKDYDIFMAVAEKAGHNKNGKPIFKINKNGTFILDKKGNKILDDDLPIIAENYKLYRKSKDFRESHLGFLINSTKIKEEYILIPKYFNPEIQLEIETLKKTKEYDVYTVGELINKGILSIRRGNEIGSQFYGTGDVPFVRTSDIVNWEIKIDPVKCVADEVYEMFKDKQNIKLNDILFVNDGTFLIGRSAMITELDKKIIIQSHIKKLRVERNSLLDCYLLFYLLNTDIVRKQIESKTFVQATISSIGNRLKEVILPIPKNKNAKEKISKEIKTIITAKMELRKRSLEILKNGS
jgi:type I restriction enzyme M protein